MSGTTHFRSKLRYANPLVNDPTGKVLEFAGLPLGLEPFSRGKVYYNGFTKTADFDTTNDWTVTETQAGATQALSDDVWPSYLRLVNSAADNDVNLVQYTAAGGAGEIWKLVASKKRYFEVSFRTGAATAASAAVTESNIFLGFQITNADQFGAAAAPTDYIGFYKKDGAGVFNFVSDKNSAAAADDDCLNNTLVSSVLTLTSADAMDYDTGNQSVGGGGTPGVFHTLGALIVPSSTVTTCDAYVFVDHEHVGTVTDTASFCDDEELCWTLGIKNGEAVLKVLDIGHILFWAEL